MAGLLTALLLVLLLCSTLISGAAIVQDTGGPPSVLLHIALPRSLYEQGPTLRYGLLGLLAVLGLGFGLGLGSLLLRLVNSQRAQQESERLYRSFVEQTAEGVLLADATTLRLLDANAAACRLLGVPRSGAAGQQLHELLKLEPGRLEAALARSAPDEPVGVGEVVQHRPDGSLLHLDVSASSISHETKSVLSLLVRDIGERRAIEEQIRFHAFHDALTQLPNRLLFEDRLRLSLAHARRQQERLAVLFLDLDHLKEVNDCYGHAAGDRLLVDVAQRLQATVRSADTVARVGGDEFLILAPSIAHPEDTISLCNRLLDVVRQPIPLQGRELVLSASMGIALYPDDGVEVDQLVRHADAAMYHAKEHGRDCWRLYDPEMNQHVQNLAEMRGDLLRALQGNELLLHFQPQFAAGSRKLVALEALLRWQRPGQGLLAPREFLSAAEQTGLISSIGEWVLHEVCRQQRRWLDRGLRPPRIAINLSARQFLQQDTVRLIRQALAEAHLEPDLLEVEISESTAMKCPETTRRVLAELHGIGVSCVLDDFGTSSSSLGFLRRFPLSRIKIDRSFVTDLATSEDNRSLVALLLSLVHDLGLQAVAEGVQSEEVAALLTRQGCDLLQGFALGKPLPAAEAVAYFAPPEALGRKATPIGTP